MDVAEYMSGLEHARRPQVEQIRAAILASDPELSESIKWNAPNFVFEGEDRVTFRLQPGDRIELVLHRGSRKRADTISFAFHDTSGMVMWAAPDRGVIAIPEEAALDPLLTTILPVLHAWVRS
jgi:hypothetical protein